MNSLALPRLSHGVLAGLLLWAGAAAAQDAKASRLVAVKVHDTAGKAIPNAQASLDTYLDETISPSRPIPSGLAPGMQVKLVKNSKDEKVYAVIFHAGDEALSGLTDFAIANHIVDAHFTAIGAVRGATLGWLDLEHKNYHPIPVSEQCEVLSMMGDIATYNGRPVVHTHVVLGRRDGTTVGGHVWELRVNPTLEVFVTANKTPLKKRPDDASGMKFIDPTQ